MNLIFTLMLLVSRKQKLQILMRTTPIAHPSIPGYVFEHVSTPLASGDAGLFVTVEKLLKYNVLEKKLHMRQSKPLWVEISFVDNKNIICGMICRQHISPDYFLIFPQFIEGNGYVAWQTSKEQTKMTRSQVGRSTTLHNLLFCAHTLCMTELRNQHVSIGQVLGGE